jgi:hypothetical protein
MGSYLWFEAHIGPAEVLSPEDNAGFELVILCQDGLLAWITILNLCN